ncbi:queuine tRNA-ribosyltransferase accessory subunit 2 [Selaginella moellendorffii]|uniref:queuine tRNA-ribosyltransferase accessory subunit 2 n=1 Tax=Selaginella moellendorffii TaxID=88036 RepID=UPI000D1C9986|nr:queuine tRNA-ribosyltransferase accessory subunit 2 [Selaginella moellendorffii]|eukprot:XP_024526711.1 queuine tRNA-ribosyltransferase accessory subunit 2 [Selaginella moellendorffii]
MRFALKAGGGDGARCGVMNFGAALASVDTPCLLLSTRRGLPSFVSTDLLPELHPDARVLHVNPVHFLEGPPVSTIHEIGGGHKLLNLQGNALVSLSRDSIVSEPDGEGNTKLGAAFNTSSGRRVIGPAKYMELVNALKPNVWASIADELPTWVSQRRNKLSVDRTLQWLDKCLGLQSIGENTAFGTIVGGASIEERKRSASETAKRNVSGFFIGGFGLGESPEDRLTLLQSVTDCLPKDLPRIISGLGMPEEILQAVSTGVDIFDSTYAHTLTKGGYAMTFPLSMDEKPWKFSLEDGAGLGADFTKINLRSIAYRCDVTPLKPGCTCYTCQKHTRAYINHLLNTHEMVAQTLLDMHNIHHYLSFFQAIRDAICGSYFEEFQHWFIGQRRYCESECFDVNVSLLTPEAANIL